MKYPFTIPVVALAAAAIAACPAGPPDRAGESAAPETPSPEPSVAASVTDSLRLRLELPDQVRAGQPVPIALRVENVSGRSLDLSLRGREIAFDIVVSEAEPPGAVVWQRLEGEIIPAILQLRTLAPGELLELGTVWDQRGNDGRPVGPGQYVVRGLLLTDEPEPLATEAVPLRILPA